MAIREMLPRTRVCRLCKEWEGQARIEGRRDWKGPMIHYAVRHYAHAECGLKKWGAGFFDKLRGWQLRNFPALIADRLDLFEELEKRVKQLPPLPDYDAIEKSAMSGKVPS